MKLQRESPEYLARNEALTKRRFNQRNRKPGLYKLINGKWEILWQGSHPARGFYIPAGPRYNLGKRFSKRQRNEALGT